MDLLKPKYILKAVKALLEKGEIIPPNISVIQDALDLGFTETDAYDQIRKLEWHNFCKTTNENYNHNVWQDVYKKTINNVPVYIKFKLFKGCFLLTSFKKDTDE